MASPAFMRSRAVKLILPVLITLLFAYSFYSTIVEVGAEPKQMWYAHVGDENGSWQLEDVEGGFWHKIIFYQHLGLWMPNVTDKRLMLLAKVKLDDFKDGRVAVYADDCIEEFYVNGKPLRYGSGGIVFSADTCFGCKHCEGVDLDLKRYLVDGENTIAIRIRNYMGPAWYTFEWLGARFISPWNTLLFTLAAGLGLLYTVLSGMTSKGHIRPTFMNILTLAVVLLLVGRLNELYSSTPTQKLFWDEEYWLQGTYFYHLLFHRGDLSNPDWGASSAIDHPHLFHYVLGGALDLAKVDVAKTSAGRSEWMRLILGEASKGLENPIESDKLPGHSLLADFRRRFLDDLGKSEPTWFGNDGLLVGRYTVFYIGVALLCSLVFFSIRYLKKPLVGVLWAYLFIAGDATTTVFQQVLSESLCYIFVLLSLMVLVHLFKALRDHLKLLSKGKGIRRHPLKSVVFYSVLEGVLLALALSTKFSTGFMLVVLIAAFALAMVLTYLKSGKRAYGTVVYAGTLLVILIVGCTSFVIINPNLHKSPVVNTLRMVDYRLTWIRIQSSVWLQRITSLSQKAGIIYSKGVLLGLDIDGSLEVALLQMILIGGLYRVVRQSYTELVGFSIGPHTLILLLSLTVFTVYASMIHIDDTRYYVPLVLCVSLNLAFGMEWVMRHFHA